MSKTTVYLKWFSVNQSYTFEFYQSRYKISLKPKINRVPQNPGKYSPPSGSTSVSAGPHAYSPATGASTTASASSEISRSRSKHQ